MERHQGGAFKLGAELAKGQMIAGGGGRKLQTPGRQKIWGLPVSPVPCPNVGLFIVVVFWCWVFAFSSQSYVRGGTALFELLPK